MNSKILIAFFLLLCSVRCANKDSNNAELPQNSTQPEDYLIGNGNEQHTKDSIIIANGSPSNEDSSLAISEKYKAFNDIYFTTKPNYYNSEFSKIQTIANIHFSVQGEKYDEDRGLYEFSLVAGSYSDMDNINTKLNEIYTILDDVSERSIWDNHQAQNSSLSECNARWEMLNATVVSSMSAAHGKRKKSDVIHYSSDDLPKDDGLANFTKKFFQSGKTISVGYSICYDLKNGAFTSPLEFIKKYWIFLTFSNDEIQNIVSNQKRNTEIENREKDKNKF